MVYFIGKHKTKAENGKIESHRRNENRANSHQQRQKTTRKSNAAQNGRDFLPL